MIIISFVQTCVPVSTDSSLTVFARWKYNERILESPMIATSWFCKQVLTSLWKEIQKLVKIIMYFLKHRETKNILKKWKNNNNV